MRPLRLLVDFLTYDGTPPTNNPVDETHSRRKVEESNVTQAIRAQQTVPISTTNQVVPLAAAANDYLVIYVDQQVTISLNSGAAMTLTPQTAGIMCPVFVMRGAAAISSLTVSNASATVVANIDVRSVMI